MIGCYFHNESGGEKESAGVRRRGKKVRDLGELHSGSAGRAKVRGRGSSRVEEHTWYKYEVP